MSDTIKLLEWKASNASQYFSTATNILSFNDALDALPEEAEEYTNLLNAIKKFNGPELLAKFHAFERSGQCASTVGNNADVLYGYVIDTKQQQASIESSPIWPILREFMNGSTYETPFIYKREQINQHLDSVDESIKDIVNKFKEKEQDLRNKMMQTTNEKLLQKYVLHRSFGTPFTNTAQVIERDGIFVPAGWDSEKRIDIMRETIPDIDTTLEPTREKVRIQPKEVLIEADDDQEFLKKLSDVLNSTNAPIRKVQNEDPVDKDSPLANFFSNLLKDKPGRTSATPPISQDQTAAQLDRFLKSATPAKSNSDVSNA